MMNRTKISLVVSVLLGIASQYPTSSAHAEAKPTAKPEANKKVFSLPEAGEYYTGVLEKSETDSTLQLRTATGVYPLSQQYASVGDDLQATDLAHEIGVFVGKKVTIRAIRYLNDNQAYLGVQMVAPGTSKDYLAGRIQTESDRQFVKVGTHRIFLKKSAADRMKQHAQTLPTTIGMGDGVIMYGKTFELDNGELEFAPKNYDAWYLMRPQNKQINAANTVDAQGREYQLLGMQTPATSQSGSIYGHLEVPVDIEMNGIDVGVSRAFVKARQLSRRLKPLFPLQHNEIKLRGVEFSKPSGTASLAANYEFVQATGAYVMKGRRMAANEVAPGHKAPRKVTKPAARRR